MKNQTTMPRPIRQRTAYLTARFFAREARWLRLYGVDGSSNVRVALVFRFAKKHPEFFALSPEVGYRTTPLRIYTRYLLLRQFPAHPPAWATRATAPALEEPHAH